MTDGYSDKHQRKGKTDYEFLKDRMRNYLSPIITYFELRRMYDNGEIPEDKKEEIKGLLEKLESKCQVNIKKIEKILKRD
ncbi:MAG: hypothetical protein AABY32_05555 [Nanoarchaeota archaeon]